MRMKAAVFHGVKEGLHLEDVELPPMGEHDALVKIDTCCVCATDVHILEGTFPISPIPRIIGHEYSGTVVEAGSSVKRVEVGDRVCVDPVIHCGRCDYCRRGEEHFCSDRRIVPGGFSEYALAPDSQLYRLPEGVSFEAGAMAEPLSCALRGIDHASIHPGSSVLIVGGGPIGLMLLMLARLSGAYPLILSEPIAPRRKLALELGADRVIDPKDENVEEAIKEATGGGGVSLCLDATGIPPVQESCISYLHRGGTLGLVGVAPIDSRITIDPYILYCKEIKIFASFITCYVFQRAVNLMKRLNLDSLAGERFTMERIEEAIDHTRNQKGIKVLVKISY